MISQIISIFKADTSDLRAKLKDVAADEKKVVQAQLAAAEARNKSIDDWKDRLGKAAIVLGTVGATAKVAFDGVRAYGERARLEMAAGSVSVSKLSTAFGGLVSNVDLMRFAAQSQRGELAKLKLGHDEMQRVLETVGKATTALSRAGFDQDEVMQKLTGSVIKLKSEGLDDLGISFKEGKTQAETLKNMMDELGRVIDTNKNLIPTEAENAARLAKSWENAKDNILNYIGATALLDPDKGASADVANIATFGWYARSRENMRTQEANRTQAGVDDVMSQIRSDTDEWGNYVGPPAKQMSLDIGEIAVKAEEAKKSTKAMREEVDEYARALQDLRKPQRDAVDALNILSNLRMNDRITLEEYNREAEKHRNLLLEIGLLEVKPQTQEGAVRPMEGVADLAMPTAGGGEGIDFKAMEERSRLAQQYVEKMQKSLADQLKGDHDKVLTQIFGTPENFSAEVQVYAQGFQMLSGAVGASMDAWISGSMSAGAALKGFLAESLKTLSKDMAMQALKHLAWAAGSAAFQDYGGAAKHMAAAGAFTAAAIASGGAAKALHSSSPSSSASGGGGGSKPASGGSDSRSPSPAGESGGKSERPITIVVGEWFADESPRSRRQKADAAVERALRERDE